MIQRVLNLQKPDSASNCRAHGRRGLRHVRTPVRQLLEIFRQRGFTRLPFGARSTGARLRVLNLNRCLFQPQWDPERVRAST